MVQTIPAEVPERRRARAKRVPATGEMVEDNRVWIEKRSTSCAVPWREAPAVMRMAEFTKSAKRKRERKSSRIEVLRQCRIAAKEGWYFSSVGCEVLGGWWWSKARTRDCTIPLPRYKLCGITVAPRIPHDM